MMTGQKQDFVCISGIVPEDSTVAMNCRAGREMAYSSNFTDEKPKETKLIV